MPDAHDNTKVEESACVPRRLCPECNGKRRMACDCIECDGAMAPCMFCDGTGFSDAPPEEDGGP